MGNPILIFDCGGYESNTIFVDTEGWPTRCADVLLRAQYPEGRILAVVRDAEWYIRPIRLHADMRHFALSPTVEARLRLLDDAVGYREWEDLHAPEKAECAAKALAEFVQLPTEFVDYTVFEWESWLLAHPTWNDGKPHVDEQERLAIIKEAVAASRQTL